MRRFALSIALCLALGSGQFAFMPAALAACDPGDKIDRSTAADAKQKIEAAGYAKVAALHKGCDNVWHGKAVKDGTAVDVALTPQGQVFREAD